MWWLWWWYEPTVTDMFDWYDWRQSSPTIAGW